MSRPDQTRPYETDVPRRLGVLPRVSMSRLTALLATIGVLSMPLHAQNTVAANQLPTGGQVAAGQASISQTANTLNVNQTSQRAVVDWQSFNVGSQAPVSYTHLTLPTICSV